MKYLLLWPIKILWAIIATVTFGTCYLILVLWHLKIIIKPDDSIKLFVQSYNLRNKNGGRMIAKQSQWSDSGRYHREEFLKVSVWRWALSPNGRIVFD